MSTGKPPSSSPATLTTLCPQFPPTSLAEFSPPFDISDPRSLTEYLHFGRDCDGRQVDKFVQEAKEQHAFLGTRVGDVVADAREYPWFDRRYCTAEPILPARAPVRVARVPATFFHFDGSRPEDFTVRLPPEELEEEETSVSAADVKEAFQAVDRGVVEELSRLSEAKKIVYDMETSTITLPFDRLISPTDPKRRLGDYNYLKQNPRLLATGGKGSSRYYSVLAILRFSKAPEHWRRNDPATDQAIQNHLHSLMVAGITTAARLGYPLNRVYVVTAIQIAPFRTHPLNWQLFDPQIIPPHFQGVTKLPLLHLFDLIVIYGSTGAGLLFFDADLAAQLFDFLNPPPPPPPPPAVAAARVRPPPPPPPPRPPRPPSNEDRDEDSKDEKPKAERREKGKESGPKLELTSPFKHSARFCFLVVGSGRVTAFWSSFARFRSTIQEVFGGRPTTDTETLTVLRDLTTHLRSREELGKGISEGMKKAHELVKTTGISSWRNRNAGIQRNLSAGSAARKMVAPITGSSLAAASGVVPRITAPVSSRASSSNRSSSTARSRPPSTSNSRLGSPQPQTTVVFSKVEKIPQDLAKEQAKLAEPRPLNTEEIALLRAFPSPETILNSPPAPLQYGPRLPQLLNNQLDEAARKQISAFVNPEGRRRALKCDSCQDSFHLTHINLFKFHSFYHSKYSNEIETCERCGGFCPRRFLRAHIQSCQGQLNYGPSDTRNERKNRFVYWFGY